MWRRSGFWTTTLQSLDLDALRRARRRASGVPDVVARTLPDGPRAGRIVQSASAIVHVELDPALAERGVILCSLEDAFREHPSWSAVVLQAPDDRPQQARGGERGVLDAAARSCTCPRAWSWRSRSRSSTRSTGRAWPSTHARWCWAARAATSACTSTTWRRTSTGPGAARGRVRAVPAGRRALPPGAGAGLGQRRGVRRLDALRGRRARRLLPLAAGAAGRAPGAPAPGAGGLGGRAATWPSAACSSPRSTSTWTCSRSTCTRPARPAGTCTGAARRRGESRASFEGLIQIDPGAQQTHTYLQIHSMMLSPKARIDAIPSVLVSADDVSASHGGTVGELDEDGDLLHADPRPGPPVGGARDRGGLLRAAGGRARRTSRWKRSCARRSRRSWRRRARTSRRMPPVAESDLFMRPPPGVREGCALTSRSSRGASASVRSYIWTRARPRRSRRR